MPEKKTITERYEICTLCAGRGQELAQPMQMTTAGALHQKCRGCGGTGQKLVERTITTEELP